MTFQDKVRQCLTIPCTKQEVVSIVGSGHHVAIRKAISALVASGEVAETGRRLPNRFYGRPYPLLALTSRGWKRLLSSKKAKREAATA